MSAPKRIALIVPDCGEGGLFQFYNQFVPELARRTEVHVIFASPFHTPHVPSIAGAHCHILHGEDAAPALEQVLRGPLVIAPTMARSVAVANLAWEKALSLEPDCVEVCDWPLSLLPAILAQSLPCVVQCHGSMGQIADHDPQVAQGIEPALVQLLEPQLIAAAGCVQTYSESNARFWQTMTGRTVQMIRPAFALPDLPSGTDGISSSAAVFGRLQQWKGPHILCEALRLLDSRAPDVDWYGGVKPWAGDGLTADRFLADGYPDLWNQKFHHHSTVSRPVVAEIQARALFNIVPSTWDVFNFTAVESMAAGRPTIVSTGAGASELIVDCENGFTFVNEDPESLATAIDCILSLTERRRREIGEAGRETVRFELDPTRIAEQRLAAYEEAIRSFRTSPPQRPNSWFRDFLGARAECEVDASELLEVFPIATIGKHMKDRLLHRFIRGARRW